MYQLPREDGLVCVCIAITVYIGLLYPMSTTVKIWPWEPSVYYSSLRVCWPGKFLLHRMVINKTFILRFKKIYHIWTSIFLLYLDLSIPFSGPSSLGVPGVPWHTQYLADQLTLFQPGGTDYAHLITTGIPRFSDLPTALYCNSE